MCARARVRETARASPALSFKLDGPHLPSALPLLGESLLARACRQLQLRIAPFELGPCSVLGPARDVRELLGMLRRPGRSQLGFAGHRRVKQLIPLAMSALQIRHGSLCMVGHITDRGESFSTSSADVPEARTAEGECQGNRDRGEDV